MISREIPILLANVFKLTSSWIYNLNIASHILVAPNFAEVVEARNLGIRSQFLEISGTNSLFICNFGHIEFMIT